MAASTAQKRSRPAEGDEEQQNSSGEPDAAPKTKKPRREDRRQTSLFVKGLPTTLDAEKLTEFFSQHFPVKHATIVRDPKSKLSRGYGFVTFTDAQDAVEAKAKLATHVLEGRRLTLDVAEPRHRSAGNDATNNTSKLEKKQQREENLAATREPPPKLIVRNLPWSIKTSVQLSALFQSYGKILFADLPQDKGKLKGFGFVTFKGTTKGRSSAERAIEAANGKVIDGRTIAVDWAVDKQTWQNLQAAPTVKDGGSDEESKDDEQEGANKITEEDADLRDFMQRMEHLEDEDDEDEDEERGEGADVDEEPSQATSDSPKEKRPAAMDNSSNDSTVFIRNLPYAVTDETLKEHFNQIGKVRYARTVQSQDGRPAGTAFVCFFNAEDARACLRAAPRRKPASAMGKRSVLQDEMADQDGRYTMEGRVLDVAQAVSKQEATRLSDGAAAARKGQDKDKRRLYLLSEGTVSRGSSLYASLPPTEVKMRESSAKQRKKMVESNPSLHLSLTRLALRNIPRNLDSKALKALARQAVVGFAKDVKEGRRQPISKEENARGGQPDKEAERRRKEKGKGVVTQAKVVFESKQGSKVTEEIGGGKSRGYGFIEYSSHRWALMGLRWLNGYAMKNEAGKTSRFIVEFAIENANVVSRRKQSEDKARGNEQPGRARGTKGRSSGAVSGRKGSEKGHRGSQTIDTGANGGEKEETNELDSKKVKADAKLALRQRIIGRKRMMRKKKTQVRQGK